MIQRTVHSYDEQALQERIQRGVELLDSVDPGWQNKINLYYLDMNDCKFCILGQLFKDYDDGLLLLMDALGEPEHEDSDLWAVEHGFQQDVYNGDESYSTLDQAWKQALTPQS